MLCVFRQNVYIFNIFVYIIYIVPLNILKNGQNDEVYFAIRAKKWGYWENVRNHGACLK